MLPEKGDAIRVATLNLWGRFADRPRRRAILQGVAIVSRFSLNEPAVGRLPPSHPPRQRLEASVASGGGQLRLTTLHAAVSPAHERDAQIGSLSRLTDGTLVLGADLNAEPSVVRPLLNGCFLDTLDWDVTPTWPVDADAFVRAWEDKLGERPCGEPKPGRVDYLLVREATVRASGMLTFQDDRQGVSDHRLVWADLSVARAARRASRLVRWS